MKSDLGHFKLSDTEFMSQFKNCRLDPSVFSHEAHLRLAWIHIHSFGLAQARENIQKQLQDFVEHVGAKDKYHKTLTIVAIEAVHHFMQISKSHTFKNFMVEFPQLKDNFKGLINSHYSFDIFQSEEARFEYIKPDVLAFDESV